MKQETKQRLRELIKQRREGQDERGLQLIFRNTLFFARDYRGEERKIRIMYCRIFWRDVPSQRDEVHKLITGRDWHR